MGSSPEIRGVSHLSLSVSDLDRSLGFYRDTLQLAVLRAPYDGVVFDGRQAMVLAGRTALSLQEHRRCDGRRFDPLRVGLDHLAFDVVDRGQLQWWTDRLDGAGVPNSGIKDVPGWGSMVELRDPDGIQLELFTLDRHAGAQHE